MLAEFKTNLDFTQKIIEIIRFQKVKKMFVCGNQYLVSATFLSNKTRHPLVLKLPGLKLIRYKLHAKCNTLKGQFANL